MKRSPTSSHTRNSVNPALATYELTKDYAVGFWRKRPYRALDRLTLEVESGDVFGFLGPNGAGKTTTLKLLMRLVFPTSGRAEIFGRPVGDVGVKRRFGYLPENPYFYDYLTAEELLRYFARLFGFSAAESRARASRLLDEVGIERERSMQLRKFSKGMLQRVGIAQALINDPDLVIFDEPMSGLDPLGRRDVRTVFFSSHVLSDAEALCNRVAILAKGRLVATGKLTDILAFRARGWELVVSDAPARIVTALGPRARRIVQISEGRYMLDLPLDPPPERLLAELTTAGAHLVSLNPIRDTLEDFFVERVTAPHLMLADHRPAPSESERGWGPASSKK
ncbi:MAG: ABC transporter [Acidobacteria bacterium]|nr:MAG: ABC transporter [Acidobacteriota bacterium]